MKKLILLITSILIVSVNLMAQNSVWMTINESQNVPQMRGDKLYSQNQELNSVLETYQITNVQKVFPDSKIKNYKMFIK